MPFQIADVFGARQRAGSLAGQVNAGCLTEAESPGPIHQRPRSHLSGKMKEVDVATHGERVGQHDLAMSDALANVEFAPLPVGLV